MADDPMSGGRPRAGLAPRSFSDVDASGQAADHAAYLERVAANVATQRARWFDHLGLHVGATVLDAGSGIWEVTRMLGDPLDVAQNASPRHTCGVLRGLWAPVSDLPTAIQRGPSNGSRRRDVGGAGTDRAFERGAFGSAPRPLAPRAAWGIIRDDDARLPRGEAGIRGAGP